VGPAARASGVATDARREWAHGGYAELPFEDALEKEGDVLARVRVKAAEADQSADLVARIVRSLPPGPVATRLGLLQPATWGWGASEAHRGEVVHGLVVDAQGRVAALRIRDPSTMNWRALERAVPRGNILADFPVVNKSFNLSYAGNDR
jgi:Ni,Fe-hydrogenase III large subunit